MSDATALFAAIRAGDVAHVRELVARDPAAVASRGPDGLSPVTLAAYHGRSDVLDVLVATHPVLDVFEASTLGDTDRLRELLDADPTLATAWSPDGFTALHLGAFFGRREAARLLLDRGARVDAVSRNGLGVMPINSAAAAGHADVLRLLLNAGSPVSNRDGAGFTPLHAAAQNGDAACARLLLHAGADVSARAHDARTPADLAREAGHAEVALLIGPG